ncbi:WGxxGxxG family protein [Paenibacillus sp. 1-18]|uniref:WGxxGxxG family protein n=1 Tax=Paenibacillus sp. 1-18 TaxID=1333846 RepID=UPI0004703537|nr:WGxxGxxG family protein [Paenibacillus sp. 1-18]
MKKVKTMLLMVIMISSIGESVAFAETSTTGTGTNETGTAQMQTTNNNGDDDNDNWGWLGLIGLAIFRWMRGMQRVCKPLAY